MSDWFESWFDTSFYHILYKNRDHNEARNFVEQLTSNLNISPEAFILDLCCGKGRHAIHLNELGYRVHGVDLSEKSIEHAKSFENERLTFEINDMRNAVNNGPFDVVFNLFTSFGYFDNQEDNESVLRSISTYLKKEGILVIDYLNAENIIKDLPMKEVVVSEGIEFQISKQLIQNTISKEITFTDQDVDYVYSEKVQAFKLADFKEMLTKTGFNLMGVYGDYDLSDFDETSSQRMIIKAKLI